MSHFSVLVIGEDVEEQLKMYDENLEVAFEDQTEEFKAEYENDTVERVRMPDGRLLHIWDDEFRIPGTIGTGTNTHKVPNHLKIVNIPQKKIYRTFDIYCEVYHGAIRNANGLYGYMHNPKAKWDWFQIGGRFSGRLPLIENPSQTYPLPNFSWEWEEKEKMEVIEKGLVNSAKKGDIDWNKAHMNKEEYDKAIRFWDMKVLGADPITEKEKESLKWDLYKPSYYVDRYKDSATYATCQSSFTMWAYVQNGEWFEKGKMGWWGLSSESHDEAILWELEFFDVVIKPLSNDEFLTVVDCHI